MEDNPLLWLAAAPCKGERENRSRECEDIKVKSLVDIMGYVLRLRVNAYQSGTSPDSTWPRREKHFLDQVHLISKSLTPDAGNSVGTVIAIAQRISTQAHRSVVNLSEWFQGDGGKYTAATATTGPIC